jgi:GntR family transcriptional regulator
MRCAVRGSSRRQVLEFSASAGRLDPNLPAGLDLPVRLRRRYIVGGEPFALVEAYLPAQVGALGEERVRQLSVYDIVQHYLGLRIGRADVAIECRQPSHQIANELGLPKRTNVLVMHRTILQRHGPAMRAHAHPHHS